MTAESLLLRAPDYASWTMANRPDGTLAQAFTSLAEAFDARPIVEACACGAVATHARAYIGSTDLILLCDSCGARLPTDEVLHDVTAFSAALDHVSQTCARGRRRQQRRIVRKLGRAKGMPKRITERTADCFLFGIRDPGPRLAPRRRR
jgi:hypothetical protein